MKPYYTEPGITIYHGNCLEVLPELDLNNTVLLTDPVYGVEGGKGGDSRDYAKAKYERSGWTDDEAYIRSTCVPAVEPVLRQAHRGAVTPGIRNMWLYPRPADIGCFWTPAGAVHSPWGITTFHPILYYGKDYRAGKNASPTGRQVTEMAQKNGHPCPKPIRAWQWLCDKVAQKGETVIDPFLGSGTTLAAARFLGLDAIGIEIEERYCELAVLSIRQGVLL